MSQDRGETKPEAFEILDDGRHGQSADWNLGVLVHLPSTCRDRQCRHVAVAFLLVGQSQFSRERVVLKTAEATEELRAILESYAREGDHSYESVVPRLRRDHPGMVFGYET